MAYATTAETKNSERIYEDKEPKGKVALFTALAVAGEATNSKGNEFWGKLSTLLT